jgi:hypothetical protein
MMQVHYDSVTVTGKIDASGVRLYTTTSLRANQAWYMTLGDPGTFLLPIPGGQSFVHYETSCSSACTTSWPNDITVVGSFLHMHAVGKQMWTSHWRGNQQLPISNKIEYWDFNFQQVTGTNYVIQRGDRLNTHCVFDTLIKGQSQTLFGADSDAEMCMDFLLYYPRIPSMSYCGYIRPPGQGGANRTWCGVGYGSSGQNPEQNEFDPSGQEIRVFGNPARAVNCSFPAPIPTFSSTAGSTAPNAASIATPSVAILFLAALVAKLLQ